MDRRDFTIACTVGAGLLAGRAQAQSGPWPNRPIRIVVPFPPGTANDIAARALAQQFGPQLEQPVVVENVTGAGGTIGAAAAAQSRNGHTLFLASTAMTIAPYFSAVKYDVARDFDAIGMISLFPCVLVVPANSSYRTLADIVADAKARPGKVIAGTGGAGTSSHLATELFMGQAGITFTQVPYRGEGALVPDIIAGTIPLAIVNMPSALRFIRGGQLRALAVAAAQPHADLAGVQTFAALGVPKVEALGWIVLLASKGVPPEGLTRLERMLEAALTNPSVAASLVASGVNPVPGGRARTEAFVRNESRHWGDLIKARNIKVD